MAAPVGAYAVLANQSPEQGRCSLYEWLRDTMPVTVLAPGGQRLSWLVMAGIHVALWVTAAVYAELVHDEIQELPQKGSAELTSEVSFVVVCFAIAAIVTHACFVEGPAANRPETKGAQEPRIRHGLADGTALMSSGLLIGVVLLSLLSSFAVVADTARIVDAANATSGDEDDTMHRRAIASASCVSLGAGLVIAFFAMFLQNGDNTRDYIWRDTEEGRGFWRDRFWAAKGRSPG